MTPDVEPLTHSEMSRGEWLARLQQRVTALANDTADTATTLRLAADHISDVMNWSAGEVLVVDDDSGWDDARSSEPTWNPEAGSLALPVVTDGQPVAVLRFSNVDAPDTGDDLLDALVDVGHQLGLLVERNRIRDELEAVNTELERSNQELEQFAYIASHDLQEPLRKIIGFTDLLSARYGDQLDGEAKEFFGYVVDGAYRMRELITDLLAYSRAGRRRPTMTAVALDEVVDDALADLSSAITDAAATVHVERPLPKVRGNASELRELMVNLVGNAIKYRSDDPPAIVISATRTGREWRLTVQDNGIGIDPAHHDDIFDVFRRLHPRGTHEGTGIGLAVCRRVAEHHDGRLWVESTVGEGSCFHLTLAPALEGTT